MMNNHINDKIKHAMPLIALCLTAGCAAPKPADCHGDFKPINAAAPRAEAAQNSHIIVHCGARGVYGQQG